MTTRTPTDRGSLSNSPLADPAVRDRLYDLPPSSKLIARVLAEVGPLPKGDIAERTLLPTRTVQYGLTSLEDADLVASRPSLKDARKQVYVLQTVPAE